MAKFHIKKDGMPGKCTASTKACPLGGEDDHFDSLVDAAKAIEARMKSEELPVAAKKPVAFETQVARAVEGLLVSDDLHGAIIGHTEEMRAELEAYVEAENNDAIPPSDKVGRANARWAKQAAEKNMVKKAMEIVYDTEHFPESLRARLWDNAWEQGHSSGYNDVERYYEYNAELAQEAYEAGQTFAKPAFVSKRSAAVAAVYSKMRPLIESAEGYDANFLDQQTQNFLTRTQDVPVEAIAIWMERGTNNGMSADELIESPARLKNAYEGNYDSYEDFVRSKLSESDKAEYVEFAKYDEDQAYELVTAQVARNGEYLAVQDANRKLHFFKNSEAPFLAYR